jgi:hypothetical protein
MVDQQGEYITNGVLASTNPFTSNPYISPYTYQYSYAYNRADMNQEQQSMMAGDHMRPVHNGLIGEGNAQLDPQHHTQPSYPYYPDAFSEVFTNNLRNTESGSPPPYTDEFSTAYTYTDHGLATAPSTFSTPQRTSSQDTATNHTPSRPTRAVPPNTYKRVTLLEYEMVQIRPTYKPQLPLASKKQRSLRLTLEEHIALLDLRKGMSRVGSTRYRAKNGLPAGYAEREKESANTYMRLMSAASASTGAGMYGLNSYSTNVTSTPALSPFQTASTTAPDVRIGLLSR